MPRWNFRVMSDAEKSTDSKEGEFFRDDAVSAVVRESVQNSLDAADEEQGSRVRVRFFLSGATKAISAQSGALWFDGLQQQIAISRRVPTSLRGRDRIPFLVIEDFGTKGLVGNSATAWHPEDSVESNDFYFFWRALGTTGKRNTARGSWGVGKSTYQQVSAIRTFFGLTVRSDDRRQLLMGEARLGVRSQNSVRFDQFAYFGEFSSADRDFVTPTETVAAIQQFRTDFGLERTSEPGFSCVVPLAIDADINDDSASALAYEFALASIHHFAMPILAGQLRIDVSTPTRNIILENGESVRRVLEQMDLAKSGVKELHDKNDLLASVALTQWSLNEDVGRKIVHLVNESPQKAAQWQKIRIPESELHTLRAKFESSEAVALHVPVTVRRKDGQNVDTGFKVFLQQSSNLKKSSVRYIRQGLTISDVRSPNLGGVAALVVVEEGPLAELLRSAENPSHTTWKREDRLGDRLNHDFTGGESRIGLVVDAPKVLVSRLLESNGAVDYDLLSEFFPIPTVDGIVVRKNKGHKDGKNKPPGPPALTKTAKPLLFTELTDGFSFTRDKEVPLKQRKFVFRIAFSTALGDPFKAWEKFDFEIGRGGISCDCVGGSRVIEGNKITATIRDDSFRLVVRGFHPERDLAVETPRWISSKNAQDTPEESI